jgi:hypothetical protein
MLLARADFLFPMAKGHDQSFGQDKAAVTDYWFRCPWPAIQPIGF